MWIVEFRVVTSYHLVGGNKDQFTKVTLIQVVSLPASHPGGPVSNPGLIPVVLAKVSSVPSGRYRDRKSHQDMVASFRII